MGLGVIVRSKALVPQVTRVDVGSPVCAKHLLAALFGDEVLEVQQAAVVDGGGDGAVAALDVDVEGIVRDVNRQGRRH